MLLSCIKDIPYMSMPQQMSSQENIKDMKLRSKIFVYFEKGIRSPLDTSTGDDFVHAIRPSMMDLPAHYCNSMAFFTP